MKPLKENVSCNIVIEDKVFEQVMISAPLATISHVSKLKTLKQKI
jgi:hypothetical protein